MNRYKSTMMVVGISMLFMGCGDEDNENTGEQKDPNGDGTVDGNELRKYCPGEFKEKEDKTLCIVSARDEYYTDENVENENALTWKKDILYVLQGRVFIGDGIKTSTLTIEPGTTILGSPETDPDNASSLIIQRNSKISAIGTTDDPIVFTSGYEKGERASDDWGGLVINGNAPINTCDEQPCESTGEGNTGKYGGGEPDDDSGELAYIRIEFSGKRLSSTKEFNGLSLQGVGRKTKIHHIQIHKAGDDSIEFFGGTAQVHHLLLTGTGDDFFDWTNGWTGKAQFVIAMDENQLKSDYGIEADNHETEFDKTPRSNPVLYNFTLPKGVLLRRGTGAKMVNFLVSKKSACFNVENSATWKQKQKNELTISHSLVLDENCFVDDDAEGLGELESDWWKDNDTNRVVDDFMLTDSTNNTSPDYSPKSDSPALEGAGDAPEGDDFIEDVEFVGGMGPDDWTAGWTDYPEN